MGREHMNRSEKILLSCMIFIIPFLLFKLYEEKQKLTPKKDSGSETLRKINETTQTMEKYLKEIAKDGINKNLKDAWGVNIEVVYKYEKDWKIAEDKYFLRYIEERELLPKSAEDIKIERWNWVSFKLFNQRHLYKVDLPYFICKNVSKIQLNSRGPNLFDSSDDIKMEIPVRLKYVSDPGENIVYIEGE